MLRSCVLDFGGSWDVHLSLVEFSYNNSYYSSVRCAPFEALYGRKCHSLIMWAKVGEFHLIGPELVQETTEKISQIKDRLKAARDRQKSYADKRRKPLEFNVGDYVLLKVSPWRGVVRIGKKGKLAPRFVGPFEIIEKVGFVAYWLDLPKELNGVHDTFHPVKILEREFKKLKRSRIAIVKVRWNSKHGPEFTWEREDQMKLKYPHLFSNVSTGPTPPNFQPITILEQNVGNANLTYVFWDFDTCPVPFNHFKGAQTHITDTILRLHGQPIALKVYGNMLPPFENRKVDGGTYRTTSKMKPDTIMNWVVADLLQYAFNNRLPSNVLLISANSDFSRIVHCLKDRGYNVYVAVTEQITVKNLR
ncbi:putative reverse transcriptase domain-containing protein [Tanacetum coccineum]